jgi:hypothetical protein
VPACPSCNTSKCNDEVTGWLRRKRLDERALLLRHVELWMALPLNVSAEPDAEPAAPETNREASPIACESLAIAACGGWFTLRAAFWTSMLVTPFCTERSDKGAVGRAWSRRRTPAREDRERVRTAETAHEQPRWCTEIWCGCRQLCRHVSDERTTLAVRSDSMASRANSTASSSGGGVGESPQLSSPPVARQTRHLVEHRVERQRSVESIVPIRPHLQHPEP